MNQPSFWLEITDQYVIENFDRLVRYVKNYDYDQSQENKDGDFCQTYQHLKSVAENYADAIFKTKLYDTPQFDIPVKKVIRILATTILTAKKMDLDNHSFILALIHLLIINNKYISSETCMRYSEIVKDCIGRRTIKDLGFSWFDIDVADDEFSISTFWNKLSKTSFKPDNGQDTIYIHENNGCLILDDNRLILTDLNYDAYTKDKHRLKTEFKTAVGIDVHPKNGSKIKNINELIGSIAAIAGGFSQMRPSPKAILKTYSDYETIIVRVTQKMGVVAETIDPNYEHESGKVYIDDKIALIPGKYFLKEIREGDYLPVVRNRHPDFPFRIDRNMVSQFINDHTSILKDSYEDAYAIFIDRFKDGTRWLSDEGLILNVFDNETDNYLWPEIKDTISEGLAAKIRIKSTSFDKNGTCLIKGTFIKSEEPVEDMEDFEDNAYIEFANNFLGYAERTFSPKFKNETNQTDNIEANAVRLLGILSQQLAFKKFKYDSFERIAHLVFSMIILRMADSNEEADYINRRIDFQKAIVRFAQGDSPSAITMPDTDVEEDESIKAEKEIFTAIRSYQEHTDAGNKTRIAPDMNRTSDIIKDLVSASNSLIDKIEVSELNRIKKSICARLDVADQYQNIYNDQTNYGTESDTLEFKSSCVLPPSNRASDSTIKDINLQKWNILKAVCAFLNSPSGGELLIGVNDSGFAVGLTEDLNTLSKLGYIFEPTSDRLRTYIKLFVDNGFSTVDGNITGKAITLDRIQYIIEQNAENKEIIRIKINPFPWDVVRISDPDRPEGFADKYTRTSGASTPLNKADTREIRIRKRNALDKDNYKMSKIMQAIDDKTIVEIKNYCGAEGLSDRRLEPHKITDNRKAFMAYDINRKEMRLFKFSRFKETGLTVTGEKWKHEQKHTDLNIDIFGIAGTLSSKPEQIMVKLTDYAYSLLIEECDIDRYSEKTAGIITQNTDVDKTEFPWMLNTAVNGFAGIVRFILGLPGMTKIHKTPQLEAYIESIKAGQSNK